MPESRGEPGGWGHATGLDLRLIDVALGYYREPLRYPQFRDPRRPLPAGFSGLIPAFGRSLTPRNLENTASSLGVASREVLDAARFFVRQVLLAPGAGPWRVLGCETEVSAARLHEHYQLLIRLFHPDRQARLTELDREQAARLNQVYQALRGIAVGAERVEAGVGGDENPWMPQEGVTALRAFLTPEPAQALTFTPLHSAPPRRAVSTWRGWRPFLRHAPLALVLLAVGGGGWVLTGSLSSLRSSGFEMAMAVAPPGGELRGPNQPVASPLVPREDLTELARKAEEVRQAEEDRRAEEARLAELARKAEEVRQADEVRRAEEARLAELARKAEDARQAEEDRRAEEVRLAELANRAEAQEEGPTRAPSEASVVSRPSPDDVIDRLTNAYQAGHLEGLVSLFTPDAVTTEGRGQFFIRDDFARLFARTQRRELAIERLQWRPRKDGSQHGTGIFRVRTLPEPGQGWRENQGKIRFILIPWRDSWRIAKMEYG